MSTDEYNFLVHSSSESQITPPQAFRHVQVHPADPIIDPISAVMRVSSRFQEAAPPPPGRRGGAAAGRVALGTSR